MYTPCTKSTSPTKTATLARSQSVHGCPNCHAITRAVTTAREAPWRAPGQYQARPPRRTRTTNLLASSRHTQAPHSTRICTDHHSAPSAQRQRSTTGQQPNERARGHNRQVGREHTDRMRSVSANAKGIAAKQSEKPRQDRARARAGGPQPFERAVTFVPILAFD